MQLLGTRISLQGIERRGNAGWPHHKNILQQGD